MRDGDLFRKGYEWEFMSFLLFGSASMRRPRVRHKAGLAFAWRSGYRGMLYKVHCGTTHTTIKDRLVKNRRSCSFVAYYLCTTLPPALLPNPRLG